jgi:hypothetical protein
MPDMQQIKAAVRERDGIARLAPIRYLLPQLFATEYLVCDGSVQNKVS